MAEIYLKHPIHGFKVTTNPAEAKADHENGWEDHNPPVAEPAELPSFLGGSESDIPKDFPARDLLIAGGVTKWADLAKMTPADFAAVKDITEELYHSIVKALA